MKKLLFLLALTLLFSCEKEAEYCWTCTVTKVTVFQGGSSSTTTTTTPCGMSTREMELYAQKNNGYCTKN
jgi:hypothetical protein